MCVCVFDGVCGMCVCVCVPVCGMCVCVCVCVCVFTVRDIHHLCFFVCEDMFAGHIICQNVLRICTYINSTYKAMYKYI